MIQAENPAVRNSEEPCASRQYIGGESLRNIDLYGFCFPDMLFFDGNGDEMRRLFLIGILVSYLTTIPEELFSADIVQPEVFELKEFVVYASTIDVVDGFTGEEYVVGNDVVDNFARDFNSLLKERHLQVLRDEYVDLAMRIKLTKPLYEELEKLCRVFGVNPLVFKPEQALRIERAIFYRLVQDPFFKIDAIVVWDLDQLERMGRQKPDTVYARDIRWNPVSHSWERRVTTEWNVRYKVPGSEGWNSRLIEVEKRQGLNLDTQEGFHFVNRGLGVLVTPDAFSDVNLTYPIFIRSNQSDAEQLEQLTATYKKNLQHIYDPFSWSVRKNRRYYADFQVYFPLKKQVEAERFKVTDRDWFNTVLARFLYDVAIMRTQNVEVLYEQAMLDKVPVNNHLLGEGLDLLNWNPDEERSVSYDPSAQLPVHVDFETADGARFIMVDAYRRFPERFVTLLGEKFSKLRSGSSAKQLIKEVIEEMTGIPGDIYIEKVTPIQAATLERYRIAND